MQKLITKRIAAKENLNNQLIKMRLWDERMDLPGVQQNESHVHDSVEYRRWPSSRFRLSEPGMAGHVDSHPWSTPGGV